MADALQNKLNDKMEEGLTQLALYFDPAWFLVLSSMVFLICFIGVAPIKFSNELSSGQTILVAVRRVLLLLLGAVILASFFFWATLSRLLGLEGGTDLFLHRLLIWSPRIVIVILLALLCRFLWGRYMMPKFSALWRGLKVKQSDDELSDIQNEMGRYKPMKFTPSKFYKANSRFIGLDSQTQEPVYLPDDDFKGTHQAVIGATRYGKGITFQALAEQAILAGDCVIVIDPKGDKFLPKVLENAVNNSTHDRPFLRLDLANENTPGKWSPFKGGHARDRRSRFYASMNLQDRSTDADHYKALSRSGLHDFFNSNEESSIGKLQHFIENNNKLDDKVLDAMSTVRARLKEWKDYPKLNPKPKRGFSIEDSIRNNAVMYVRGSLDDQVIRTATTAFIIEIMQEAKRLQSERKSHMTIFVDELRFLVSKTLVDALATIAGFGVNITVAFQSLGDLETPEDVNLDGKAIAAAVLTNAQVKLIFGGTDAYTAEYVAELSGTTLKKVAKFEGVQANDGGGELWEGKRMMADVEEALIPANVALSLPKRVGVLLRPNKLAKVISVSPVPVELDSDDEN